MSSPPSQPYQGQPYQGEPQPGQPYQGEPQLGQPQLGQPYPPAPRKKSPILRVVLIVLAVGLVLCIGGVAFVAIATRNELADLAEAAKITVVEPAALGGRPKASEPQFAQSVSGLKAEMAKVPGATSSVGAIYGDAAKQDLVMIGAASSLTGTAQSKFDEFVSGMQEGGFKTTDLRNTDPGPLGGIAKCGDTSGAAPMAICVWSDNGSLGMVAMFFKKVADLEKEFVALRGQVEQRS